MSKIISLMALLAVALLAATQLTAQSNVATIEEALSPLPESLRADATVFTYDERGNRVILKAGTNQVECRPKDDQGVIRCAPVSQGPRLDLQAQLSAQGLSGEALQKALLQAEFRGEIAPRKFGMLSYRIDKRPDWIQYLWVVSLPFATAEELGMPTVSQMENSLAGKGTPWMMQEGTGSAHLMIPVNGTEYSNKGR